MTSARRINLAHHVPRDAHPRVVASPPFHPTPSLPNLAPLLTTPSPSAPPRFLLLRGDASVRRAVHHALLPDGDHPEPRPRGFPHVLRLVKLTSTFPPVLSLL